MNSKKTPYQAVKARRRKSQANGKQTDASTSRASQKQENRYNNSGGSLQAALNRKGAFDNESQMMDETETEGNATYETSTTDYLGSKEARSRNLNASFDSDNTPDSRARKDPTPTVGTMSIFSQNSIKQEQANARERKRLQEREWDRDRQRKATAELNKLSRNRSDAPSAFEDKPRSLYDCTTLPVHPRSSRQLGGNGLEAPATGRDGYDSDSYIKQSREQLNNARQKTARASIRNSYQGEDSRTQDQHQHQHQQRQPNTISTILAGDFQSEELTMGGMESHLFENSLVDYSRATDATSHEGSYLAESEPKIKMTKMEKIKQLQMKNDRYKEEYKKTYLEKKEFKKKYDDKKMEVASLTTEIESYMKETALLKKQLSQLTHEMEADSTTRKDFSLVTKLQQELRQAQADLKEALGRIAERKMESSRLNEILDRKDEQIESLTLEVSRQIEEVQKLQAQISLHDMGSVNSSQIDESMPNDSVARKLRNENKHMKEELAVTLNRAAEMVKNREGTIELLRKENHELKELLDIRDQGDERPTTSERLQRKENDVKQLKVEIAGLKETLEQSVEDREQLKDVLSKREAELESFHVDIDGLKKMVKRAEKDAHKARKEAEEKDSKIASLQDEIRQLGNHCKDAERNIQETTNVVHERDAEIEGLMQEIESLKANQNGSSYELGRARGVLEQKEQELKDLYRDNEDLKAEMLQQREQLDERRKRVVLELEEMKVREQDLHGEIAESAAMVKQREDAIEDLLKEVERLQKGQEDIDNHRSEEISKHQQNVVAMMKDTENMRRQLNDKGQELEHTRSLVKERELAIEDLLRDIERLKQQGLDVEKEVADRTDKLRQELKAKNKEVEKLREDIEEITNRLDETQHALQSKTDLLQEREESIEDLLQDMTDLKKEYDALIQQQDHKQAPDKQAPDNRDMETLKRELETANDLVQKKEDKLRSILKENQELKYSLENIRAEKERLQQKNETDDDQSEEGDTKSYLIAQHEVLEEEIQQLNDQVSELQEELEDAHRQNSILNEEVEDWLQRGGNFEQEIQRLKNEIEEWEDQAEQLKAAGGHGGGGATDFDNASTENGGDQQAMMLEKAMAERQRKNGGEGKGVWGLIFNKSEEGPELTEDQKRIKELEAIKDAQADELQKIKSDLVKLTTTSRNDSYVSKKRIADLEEENKGYKAKVDLLLRRLAEAQGVPDHFGDEKKSDDETASSHFPHNIL